LFLLTKLLKHITIGIYKNGNKNLTATLLKSVYKLVLDIVILQRKHTANYQC